MPANFYKVQLFNTEKQTKQKENKAKPHIIKRIYLKFPSYTDTNQAVMTFYHIFIYSFTQTFAYDDIYVSIKFDKIRWIYKIICPVWWLMKTKLSCPLAMTEILYWPLAFQSI